MAALIAPVAYLTMGIMGALEQEHLATYVYCSQSVARIISCFSLMEPSQAVGNGVHLLFACVHVGVLVLIAHDRWTWSLMLLGAGLTSTAAAVSPFDFHGNKPPSRTLLGIGLPYLLVSAAIELFRRATTARALALVARDRERYDGVWRAVAHRRRADFDALQRAAARVQVDKDCSK